MKSRPQKPKKPRRRKGRGKIPLMSGDSLEEISKEVPEGIGLDLVIFEIDYDDPCFYYPEEEPIHAFEERARRYEEDLKVYQEWVDANQPIVVKEQYLDICRQGKQLGEEIKEDRIELNLKEKEFDKLSKAKAEIEDLIRKHNEERHKP